MMSQLSGSGGSSSDEEGEGDGDGEEKEKNMEREEMMEKMMMELLCARERKGLQFGKIVQ